MATSSAATRITHLRYVYFAGEIELTMLNNQSSIATMPSLNLKTLITECTTIRRSLRKRNSRITGTLQVLMHNAGEPWETADSHPSSGYATENCELEVNLVLSATAGSLSQRHFISCPSQKIRSEASSLPTALRMSAAARAPTANVPPDDQSPPRALIPITQITG